LLLHFVIVPFGSLFFATLASKQPTNDSMIALHQRFQSTLLSLLLLSMTASLHMAFAKIVDDTMTIYSTVTQFDSFGFDTGGSFSIQVRTSETYNKLENHTHTPSLEKSSPFTTICHLSKP
jgi:hypothetical protein